MSTILEQIAADALARLNAAEKPVGVPVAEYVDGLVPQTSELPLRQLDWGPDQVRPGPSPTSPLSRHELRLTVVDWVTSVTTPTPLRPKQVAEPFRAWSVKALVQQRLAGFAFDVLEIGTTWQTVQSDLPIVRVEHHFSVQYTTRSQDLELRA